MCSTHIAKREKKHMDLETYRKVLGRIKEEGINVVSLYTIGEPFIYPWLKEAVSIAKDMGIGVLITTNANLPDRLKDLYEAYPKWVRGFRFSVDSATPETYAKMRRGGRLEKVIESCEWISKTNKNRHMLRIALGIACIISEDNIRELGTFFRTFSKYTFPERIRFGLVNSLSPDKTYFEKHRIAFPNLYKHNVPCNMVFTGIYFNNEGQATLCCRDYDNQLVIGNVLDQPISEIWQSEAAEKIRAQHLGKAELTIPQCKQCYSPKPGVSRMLNSFIHLLQYTSPGFDDKEWGRKILNFLKDLDSVLSESDDRKKKATKILNHL